MFGAQALTAGAHLERQSTRTLALVGSLDGVAWCVLFVV